MATNLLQTSKKLMQALNTHDYNLTFNITQFMGKEGKPVNYYIIKRAIKDEDLGRTTYVDLYKSTSMLRIVLYLRDMWYEENGWELPNDQEKWNAIREQIRAEQKGECVDDNG